MDGYKGGYGWLVREGSEGWLAMGEGGVGGSGGGEGGGSAP